ncbi:hypothetical protein D910_02773 [Dendroctonus ponderosae]|uniref:Uncharacterized protein n=1 Tax=Dendroctonus ponderosae TaxID=77166 RepID=U4TZC7_DENPD|nr:hypothetical protein D910_02773 [Dendroctonus ponderosae]
MLASRTGTKSATPSPVAPGSRRKTLSVSSQEWPTNEDDIDRLVSMHHNRSSLSSLGVSKLGKKFRCNVTPLKTPMGVSKFKFTASNFLFKTMEISQLFLCKKIKKKC